MWKWQHRKLSIMKIMVLLWSTSVEKEIVALSLLSFSHILFFFFLFFFFLFLFFGLFLAFFFKVRSLIPTCGGIIVFIILSSLRQCSNNEDDHTFMDLQLKNYNSKLQQDMTLYECLCGVPGYAMNQERHVWKLWRWPCHKYDVNYMIMLRAIWQWWNVS